MEKQAWEGPQVYLGHSNGAKEYVWTEKYAWKGNREMYIEREH